MPPSAFAVAHAGTDGGLAPSGASSTSQGVRMTTDQKL